MTEPWIQTYTGLAFDLLDPDPAKVEVEDIAHALAHLCRFGGHTSLFYSVAQHSVLVSTWLLQNHGQQAALYGLLHDASEAYCVDVPRPMKRLLPDYRDIEAKVQLAVWARFGLDHRKVPAAVEEADARILLDEREALLGLCQRAWTGMEGIKPLNVEVRPWLPHVAKQAWLSMFRDLYGDAT